MRTLIAFFRGKALPERALPAPLLASLALVLWSSGLVSCLSGRESLAADVDPTGWKNEVTWAYENRDTLAVKDISFSFRYNADAKPASGRFVIEAISPSSQRTMGALDVTIDPLADNNLHEKTVVFGEDIPFSEPGRYLFSLTPFQPTFGIWSVAIELAPSGNGSR